MKKTNVSGPRITIETSKEGTAIRLRVSGTVNRVEIEGVSGVIYPDLDTIDAVLLRKVLRGKIHRADGFGAVTEAVKVVGAACEVVSG